MRPFRQFTVEDASQVGEVRRAAQALALQCGFDEGAAGRLAIGVTELGTNLVRHAGGGTLLLHCDGQAVELLSLDRGPGMDVARCLQDGYSTGGSAGNGLGAVRRVAQRFAAFSLPQRGAVIATRFAASSEAAEAPPGRLRIAGIALPAPGEVVSGDSWGMRTRGDRVQVLVADGLGHGPDAAAAADQMVALFQASTASRVVDMLEDAHAHLRSTRGAAVAVVEFSAEGTQLSLAGAGNISGRLISGVDDRGLLCQPGTLGLQIRRLQEATHDWPAHAILVLHSDGIVSRWSLADVPGLLQCDPVVIAAWIIRDHCRGRDDATVVVVRRD